MQKYDHQLRNWDTHQKCSDRDAGEVDEEFSSSPPEIVNPMQPTHEDRSEHVEGHCDDAYDSQFGYAPYSEEYAEISEHDPYFLREDNDNEGFPEDLSIDSSNLQTAAYREPSSEDEIFILRQMIIQKEQNADDDMEYLKSVLAIVSECMAIFILQTEYLDELDGISS